MSHLKIFLLIAFTSFFAIAQSQDEINTKGTDFWLGFMQNTSPGSAGGNFTEVHISSEEDTEGTIEIPAQGYSQAFSVAANSVTIVDIPLAMAEHVSNESIDNKGIHVSSEDTISVFGVNRTEAAHDASNILTTHSLGTSYRITSYQNGAFFDAGSEFLIVATTDDTQIDVTPTYETMNGTPAGSTFSIELDAGESYQVRADHPLADYTGTTVIGMDNCKPFAVFGGVINSKVPNSCPSAADHIFSQSHPVNTWGMEFLAVPFVVSEAYTLRILANEDNTAVTVDGATSSLDAGEFMEMNDLYEPRCISADKPIAVTQFMQSYDCTDIDNMNGDPAMCQLNSNDQEVYSISFSTTELQNLIEILDPTFGLNIITSTGETNNITLDGNLIDEGEFSTFPECPEYSYARLIISEGIHDLEAPDGVAAYAYGMIQAESFLYSLGAYSPTPPTSTPDPDSLMVDCGTDSLLLTAENGALDTYWYLESTPDDTLGTGSQLLLTTPIDEGLYVASSCSSDEFFNVELDDSLDVSVSPGDTTICFGDNLQLSAFVDTTQGDYTFSWSPTQGLDNPGVLNPTVSPTETTTYTLSVDSEDLCTSEAEITVGVNTLMDLNISASEDSICEGNSVMLNSMFMSNSDNLNFSWEPSIGLNDSTIANPTATVTEDVIYELTITDSILGCSVQDELELTAVGDFSIDAGEDLDLCAVEGIVLNVEYDAQSLLMWQWSNPSLLSDANIPNPTVTTNQDAEFEVTATDENGCSKTDSVSVNLLYPPLNLGPDFQFCSGDTIEIESNLTDPTFTYLWSTGETASSISVHESGEYALVLETPENCVFTDSVEISVGESPMLDLGPDMALCEVDTAILTVETNATDLVWSTGETTSTIEVANSGVFSATVTNGECESTDSIEVLFGALPQDPFLSEISYCFEQCPNDLVLDAENPGFTYQWNSSDTTQLLQVGESGIYSVLITSPIGCERSFSTEIIEECESQLYVPNAFTPDGDGINEVFGAEGTQTVQEFEMTIWNRWGDEIWSAQNQFEKWDGSDNRGDYYVENAVYTYYISYEFDDGCFSDDPQQVEKFGHVTVIR